MKLIFYLTVCFSAGFAIDSSDFVTESDEAIFISDRSEVYISQHRGQDPTDHEQNAANGNEIQDSTDEDYEDYTDDVDEQTGDMAEILGRARRCRKRLGGRCQNANKYPSCKKGYKASPKGRPFCTSKHRMCCYPGPTVNPQLTWLNIGTDRFVRFPQRMNWTAARTQCQNNGLDLYHPKNITAVVIYLDDNYNDNVYWLGAKGNTTAQIWVDDGDILTWADPWYSHASYDNPWHNFNNGTNDCLAALTHGGYGARRQSLFATPGGCTSRRFNVICG